MNDDEMSKFRARVRNHVIPRPSDRALASQIREVIDNVSDMQNGGGSRKRSLFLMGNSGSGKTFSLERLFEQTPEFQPYKNEYNQTMRPLLSVDAIEGGMVSLCNRILKELGMPENYGMKSDFAMSLITTILPAHGVIYLHIDEAQDLNRHKTPYAIRQMQEQLKSLLQMKKWPLHIIFSGVDSLSSLLSTTDDQLSNRAHVRRFGSLVLPGDSIIVQSILQTIAGDLCNLELHGDIRTEEFLERICHASSAAFGTTIETVQGACFLAVKNEHATLQGKHFAEYYRRHKGCLPEDNVFTEKNWSQISARNALADIDPTKKKKGK